jgi:hypothetical protein
MNISYVFIVAITFFLPQQDTLLTFVSGTTFHLVNLVPKC